MCNQSLQEVDLFMGLQSYRQRTLSYVLKRQPAAPSIQQGTIAWSSRWAQYTFSCSFLFLLQSQTVFEPTIPVPHAVSLLPRRQWRTRGVGLGCHVGESNAKLCWGCPGRGFPSPLHCPFWPLFLWVQNRKWNHFTLVFANIEFACAKWCQALGLCLPFFFLPSLRTQLLTQEEVGYAVTQKKRPNKSSS